MTLRTRTVLRHAQCMWSLKAPLRVALFKTPASVLEKIKVLLISLNFFYFVFFCFQFRRRKNASFKNHISTTKFPLSANKLIWTISLQLNQYHILTCIKQYPTPETNMPLTEKSGTQFNAKFLFILIQETTKLKDAR